MGRRAHKGIACAHLDSLPIQTYNLRMHKTVDHVHKQIQFMGTMEATALPAEQATTKAAIWRKDAIAIQRMNSAPAEEFKH